MKLAILFLAVATLASAQGKKIQVTTSDVKNTNHQAALTWTLPTTCVDGSPCTPAAVTVYKLVGTCSAPAPQFTKLATLSGTTRSYTDTNLAPATTYCYYVTASIAPPPAWDATVTYTGGQIVSYNSAVYVALNTANANLNQIPSSSPSFWSPSSVESVPSNMAGGSTGTTGPPIPPGALTITVQ